ncbi:transposase [Patescibacteria group bacterium]|nr:transposase [Patescibacteria group bacterium]MBU1922262.1 transposase [Patescibacteria group bacterium]
MGNIKRKHSSSFKVRVALEMIKDTESVASICSKHSIHPSQAHQWKKQAVEGLLLIFTNKPKEELKEKNELIEELYKQVGQLKVELDWLKKKVT